MIEVAHWSALAPLVYLIAFRREASAPYWIVALAFSVSWFADWGAILLEGSWALYHVYPALQFGLFALAFGMPWVLVVLVVVAAMQVAFGDMSGPEVWVTLLGSMAVMALSAGQKLGPSMIAYCGLASIFYLLMAENVWSDRFMVWWYGYQGSRLLAFALFIVTAHREAARA